MQHVDGRFNRMDIIVKYMAIEEFEGVSSGGLKLYRKMQDKRVNKNMRRKRPDLTTGESFKKLYRSIKKNGIKTPVPLNPDHTLKEGSHRLAAALYLDIDIPVVVDGQKTLPGYGLTWFRDNGFTGDEIAAIKNKYNHIRFLGKINHLYREKRQKFGRGKFYQGWMEIGVDGQRPTEERFAAYGLGRLIDKSDTVLDIGCNIGFFSLYTAKRVAAVWGVEANPVLCSVAAEVKRYTGNKNFHIVNKRFEKFKTGRRFSWIFSFAVHHWLRLGIKEYAATLYSLLRPGGHLLLESHNLLKEDRDFQGIKDTFTAEGFTEQRAGHIKDDGEIAREFVIYRR